MIDILPNVPGNGLLVALVVTAGLMAALRFGLGATDGNRWGLAALIPGAGLGTAIALGGPWPPFALAELALVVMLAAYAVGLLLDLIAAPGWAAAIATALLLPSALWVLADLPWYGGWARTVLWVGTLPVWAAMLIRLSGQSQDVRRPLVSLCVTAATLATIATLFTQPDLAALGVMLSAAGIVALLANWLFAQMGGGAALWLGIGGGIGALAIGIALRSPAALPAVLVACLCVFADRAGQRLAFGNKSLRRVVGPATQALAALAPAAVAILAALIGAATR